MVWQAWWGVAALARTVGVGNASPTGFARSCTCVDVTQLVELGMPSTTVVVWGSVLVLTPTRQKVTDDAGLRLTIDDVTLEIMIGQDAPCATCMGPRDTCEGDLRRIDD